MIHRHITDQVREALADTHPEIQHRRVAERAVEDGGVELCHRPQEVRPVCAGDGLAGQTEYSCRGGRCAYPGVPGVLAGWREEVGECEMSAVRLHLD